MNITDITAVFNKDLDRLISEIELYSSDQDMWKVSGGISNCAGNLALHISGNLQHFVGHILGNTDYIRDRPAEFSHKDVPRSELIALIQTTKAVVSNSLGGLSTVDLESPYPEKAGFGPENMTTLQALVILAGHLNYHLGQVNYHRRLLT